MASIETFSQYELYRLCQDPVKRAWYFDPSRSVAIMHTLDLETEWLRWIVDNCDDDNVWIGPYEVGRAADEDEITKKEFYLSKYEHILFSSLDTLRVFEEKLQKEKDKLKNLFNIFRPTYKRKVIAEITHIVAEIDSVKCNIEKDTELVEVARREVTQMKKVMPRVSGYQISFSSEEYATLFKLTFGL
jgi:hypothetical protein